MASGGTNWENPRKTTYRRETTKDWVIRSLTKQDQ